MSLPIYVDAYSGYKANERPRRFTFDEDTFEIDEIEKQWRSLGAAFFKVRTANGKRYLLRYEVLTCVRETPSEANKVNIEANTPTAC